MRGNEKSISYMVSLTASSQNDMIFIFDMCPLYPRAFSLIHGKTTAQSHELFLSFQRNAKLQSKTVHNSRCANPALLFYRALR
jgi:hypothetical protein